MNDQNIPSSLTPTTIQAEGSKDIFSIGDLFYWQCQYEKATTHFQSILNERTLTALDSARCYRSLGAAHVGCKNYTEALANYHKELEILQELNYPEKVEYISKCYMSIGKIYFLQEDFGNAIPWYLSALGLFSNVTPTPDIVINIHQDVANLFAKAYAFDLSLIYFRRAIELARIKLDEHHPKFGETYANIGTMYYLQENYPQALHYLSKAREIWQKSLPSTHVYLESIERNISKMKLKIRTYYS